MRFIVLLTALAVLMGGCEQKLKEEYRPPVLEGTAYVLGAADHLAVVDLKSQELTRLTIGKMAVDLVATSAGLYILSEAGELGVVSTTPQASIPWHKIINRGRALAAADDGTLLVLGEQQLVKVSVAGEILGNWPVPESVSSLLVSPDSKQIWLLSRQEATAFTLDLEQSDTTAEKRSIEALGNSIHHGFAYPGRDELWIAEGNEYRNGKPYGVGFMMDGPAMPGGINVFDALTGKQTDFVIVGGNVVDLSLSADKSKVYAAVSRLPSYDEATLSIVGADNRRVLAELRLCYSCHTTEDVELDNGQAEVRAMAVVWTVNGGSK